MKRGWQANPTQYDIQQRSYETADDDYATKNDRGMQESKTMKQIEKNVLKKNAKLIIILQRGLCYINPEVLSPWRCYTFGLAKKIQIEERQALGEGMGELKKVFAWRYTLYVVV